MKKGTKPITTEVAAPAPKPEPSAPERKAIERARERVRARGPRASLKTAKRDGHTAQISPTHADEGGWRAQLLDAFGTSSRDFTDRQLARLMSALQDCSTSVPDDRAVNAALAVLGGVAPKNEVEAMLAVQMAVTHELALELLGRARRADRLPQFESAANQATKMLRTYTLQVEALAKLRRGGEQKVTVEHVHVYPGGQAIVGAVTQAPGGGGVASKNEEQAHGAGEPRALGHSPSATLWREEPGRAAVPASGGTGQDALLDARRSEGQRSAEG